LLFLQKVNLLIFFGHLHHVVLRSDTNWCKCVCSTWISWNRCLSTVAPGFRQA